MNIYYDKDADLSIIQGLKVTIIGYGSQGHAHANNLKESGVDVTVGLRPGSISEAKAKKSGLTVKPINEAVADADVVMVLAPDEHQARLYQESIAPNIKQGAALAFAHGFNIHYQQIEPRADLDVIMIAPKGPGHLVRSTYTQGAGVPSLIAVFQDASGKSRDIACPTPRPMAVAGPALSKPLSRKRQRPTCLVNRPCCVAVRPRWYRPGLKRWWKPAMHRKWLILNACMN